MADPAVAETQDKVWLKLAEWLKRHEQLMARKDSLCDTQVVFLGDSITEGWLGGGKACWEKHFGAYKPLNLGIGGDETQHVLWRIDRGTLDGLKPKALVLLIGTNNIGNSGFNGSQSADGVTKVVAAIQKKLPNTKILLMAVLPRDPMAGMPFRREVELLNREVAPLHDGKMIHFVDYAKLFLKPDGELPKSLFPDSLHLSAEAYEILAGAIATDLKKVL